MLLTKLPEVLQSSLLSEWIDPETDLRNVVEQVLGDKLFGQLVAQRGVTVCATKVLSDECVQWLRARAVPTELLKTDRPCKRYYGLVGHEWLCNGKRHRDGDLPALVWADGDQEWWQNGQWHRDGDQPAIV